LLQGLHLRPGEARLLISLNVQKVLDKGEGLVQRRVVEYSKVVVDHEEVVNRYQSHVEILRDNVVLDKGSGEEGKFVRKFLFTGFS
jgi:hypothetical protein